MQKTILALLFGAAAAFQAPHQARASVVVQADRRSFLEGLVPAAAAIEPWVYETPGAAITFD